MTTRLSQLLAIEKPARAAGESGLTAAYQASQKPPLLSGISRTYLPLDDQGERLPPESTKVHYTVQELIQQVRDALTPLFNITLQKDATNCVAKANVTVDGQIILADAPVTYLLWLDKKLTDLNTFVKKLPLLDPAENWLTEPDFTLGLGVYKSVEVRTARTKKIPRNHEKAPATKEHPAQVEVFYEDVQVGTWSRVLLSGAIPKARHDGLVMRVRKLQEAVAFAIAEANATAVAPTVDAGAKFFGYLFHADNGNGNGNGTAFAEPGPL